MSYDIYLEIDTGGPEPATVYEIGNYTSNVARMWAKALGYRLADLHGKGAAESLPELERGVAAMESDPDGYRDMNPANGWGDYDGALDYLRQLRDGCARHPRTTIYISH